MEFPSTGIRCSLTMCKQLDFLPFKCEHCKLVFCKEHFQTSSHSCSQFVENVKNVTTKWTSYRCFQNSCGETSPVEMLCVVCKKHFCLAHRHHGCLELNENEKKKEIKKWEMPKKDFSDAKTVVDREIKEKLKKSKNSAMTAKIQLMKLKGQSVGSQGIPTVDRCYFLIYYPRSTKSKVFSKSVFVSVNWTVGKAIDSIANLLGLANFNNLSTSKLLRMFHHDNGMIVSEQMDVLLKELLKSKSLIEGQSLIFEYCNDKKVDSSQYSSES